MLFYMHFAETYIYIYIYVCVVEGNVLFLFCANKGLVLFAMIHRCH